MKILLFGKNGQVGWELQRSLALLGEVVALDSKISPLCGDLTNLEGIRETINIVRPNIVINAAAYTAVDKAQSEHELAEIINFKAVEVLAKETAKLSALLIHYSTDYVFNGSGCHYRNEDDETSPLNVYGLTKLNGEKAITSYNPRHFIFRTSWVYSKRGNNFIKTILKLAKQKTELNIINDQVGAPTGAELIADGTLLAIRQQEHEQNLYGTYNLVSSGETNWAEYAEYIIYCANNLGYETKLEKINSIPTVLYPTPAERPKNSRLSNNKFQCSFNVTLPQWKIGVERVLNEMFDNNEIL